MEREVPLVLITAAAGCGKTALLREWDNRDPREFDWVAPQALAAERDGLAGLLEPGRVIVVDGAERLPPALAARIGELAERAPESSTIVLATRSALPVAVGRLHARGVVLELRACDLAMNRMEAAMLFAAAGLRLDGEQVDALLERTQGWPVALALAAVALGADAPDVAIACFTGTDRLMADYVRTELLAPLPARLRRFARRTSLLEEPSAPLCDAVLQRGHAAATLGELSRAGVLLEPVDRSGTAYRWHPLVADVLREELADHEPEFARLLHRRAAAWHDRRGAAGPAAQHAVHAGDARFAAGVVWTWACEAAARADTEEMHAAAAAFPERVRRAHPALALTTALADAVDGRRDTAEHWLEAAATEPPSGEELAVQALVGRRGIVRMGLDAQRAAALLHPHHPLQGLVSLVAGAAHHLRGDRDAARLQLAQGARRSADGAPLFGALCEAQLAFLDAEQDDWEQAAARAAAAGQRLASVAADAPLRAPGCVAQAAAAAHLGDVAAAHAHAACAHELLEAADGFAPWLLAESLVWLARTELRLSRAGAARRLLATAARLAPRPDETPVLSAWLHDAWGQADDLAAGSTGDGPQLTIAELRILRFLPSHLSFREIGMRLHVSTNTVKTQALSVYRKLDVCSRSDAVTRGRVLGLIGG
jgi:LuxR family maltose regulon positive regulatory protein